MRAYHVDVNFDRFYNNLLKIWVELIGPVRFFSNNYEKSFYFTSVILKIMIKLFSYIRYNDLKNPKKKVMLEILRIFLLYVCSKWKKLFPK